MPPKKKRGPRRFTQADFFITTIPKMRPCERCGRWIFAGITDGLHVRVDMLQLDPGQVLLAVLANVQLYSLTRTGLVHLDQYRITDTRFGGRLPEHRCDTRWPQKIAGAGSAILPSHTDTPPY